MKYYVTDGTNRLTIDRQTPYDAAFMFVHNFSGRGIMLSPFLHVNERGFSHSEIDTGEIYETRVFLDDTAKG